MDVREYAFRKAQKDIRAEQDRDSKLGSVEPCTNENMVRGETYEERNKNESNSSDVQGSRKQGDMQGLGEQHEEEDHGRSKEEKLRDVYHDWNVEDSYISRMAKIQREENLMRSKMMDTIAAHDCHMFCECHGQHDHG
jgi:hypothetical protein